MAGGWASWPRTDLLGELAMPLWVGGLALSILFLGALGLPLSGEAFEWAEYLLLGTLFPVLAIGLAIPRDRKPARDVAVAAIQALAATVCVLAASTFVVLQASVLLLALAVLTWALGVLLYRRGMSREQAPMTPLELLVGLFLVMLAWTVSSRLTAWMPFLTGARTPPWALSALVVGASLLATAALCRSRARSLGAPLRRAATLTGLVALAFASLRAEPLPRAGAHHWGVAVGPAELVRQGGWLLWDVPAQYGFLSTLAVALTPGRTIWDAFYFLNAALLFLSASVLFLLLRGPRPGLLDCVFALALTTGVVLLTGAWLVPSVGPFRFFWCYALLAILFWRSRADPARRSVVLAGGTLAWLLGTLWSVESAAYCAAIWLPAYALLVTRERGRGRVVAIAGRLALPPLVLLSAGLLVAGYYWLRLGHGPDWPAFAEYALAFAGGFSARPIDPHGGVWALLLVSCTVATVGLRLLARHGPPSGLALAWGAWAAVWATGSYFVSRSDERTTTSLLPVFCVALALALRLLPPLGPADAVSRLVRLTLVPVFSVLLALTLGHARGLVRFATDPPPVHRTGIEALLPRADAALVDLLAQAHVEADDPVAYLDNMLNPLPTRPIRGNPEHWMASHRAWLPTDPGALFMPLAEPRGRTYVRRFVGRARLGGWLIESKRLPAPRFQFPWLVEELQLTHRATAVHENEAWRLTRFELR
jgi:hypothetical protein